MAVPKHKVSKSRRNMRRANNFKAPSVTLTECPQCHTPVRSHCVCKNCGHYNGARRIEIQEDKGE